MKINASCAIPADALPCQRRSCRAQWSRLLAAGLFLALVLMQGTELDLTIRNAGAACARLSRAASFSTQVCAIPDGARCSPVLANAASTTTNPDKT